jgi:hypothetical protein
VTICVYMLHFPTIDPQMVSTYTFTICFITTTPLLVARCKWHLWPKIWNIYYFLVTTCKKNSHLPPITLFFWDFFSSSGFFITYVSRLINHNNKTPFIQNSKPKIWPKKTKHHILSHFLRVVEYANLKVKNLGSKMERKNKVGRFCKSFHLYSIHPMIGWFCSTWNLVS